MPDVTEELLEELLALARRHRDDLRALYRYLGANYDWPDLARISATIARADAALEQSRARPQPEREEST